MLRFCSLFSGSTGNCLFVQSENTNILVDAGVSAKKIVDALSEQNIDISSISGVLVTHEHSDHVKSLGTLSRKYDIPVFANMETWDAIPNERQKISADNQKFFNVSEKFSIGDLDILAFPVPHDAANPCGFNIFKDNTKISVATDLGHIDNNVINYLKNSSFVLLEANYEPEILRYCSYPYLLKSRIAGPNGHLSNNTAGQVISTLIDSGLKSAMLGHLSKENNFPELAYRTVLDELSARNIDCNSIDISVASRFEPSKFIDIL